MVYWNWWTFWLCENLIHKAYVGQYKSHGTARSQAWSTRWWMGQYGGKTPKPHIAWSNSSQVGFLNRGKLRGWNYKSEEYERNKTCRSYVDKNGVKRFAGKKKELKQSQKLGYQHQELHMFSLGFSKCFTDFTDWSHQRFWKGNGIPFSNKYFMGHTSSTNQQLCFCKTSDYLWLCKTSDYLWLWKISIAGACKFIHDFLGRPDW